MNPARHPVRSNIPLLILLAIAFAITVTTTYLAIPTSNTSATHFDTIIVLGFPANPDGTASSEQRVRVLEAIREYRAGVAPTLILTGGPAHNQFVEAEVMARFAISQGIPASAIIQEPQAHDTIQNIFYSAQIMHAHNWSSAEIVSAPYHLRRAALIVSTLNRDQPTLAIRQWTTHASAWPAEYGFLAKAVLYSAEACHSFRLRVFGFPNSRFLPAR